MTSLEYIENRRNEIESHGRSLTLFETGRFTVALIKERDAPTDASERDGILNAIFNVMKGPA
jgi:hypothetical protein